MSNIVPCRKVFRFRMEPTAEQEQALARHAGAKRFVYNWTLGRRKEHYKQQGKSISPTALSAELTLLKKQHPWMYDVDSQMLQQAQHDVRRAFVNFFKHRAKYPRFKREKSSQQSFRIPQRVRIEKSKVYVPPVGWMRIRQSQPVELLTKSATFKRSATGQWYVTLVAEFSVPVALPPISEEHAVGIDLGLHSFAVDTSGEETANPRFYRHMACRLKRAARRFSRREKGSRNRAKARLVLCKIHERIGNLRSDFVHQFTHRQVSLWDVICVENLHIAGFAKTKLAKSILDAAFGETLRQLEYKSLWNNKRFVQVDRFFPSTQLCSQCGHRNKGLSLSDRTWSCPQCGEFHLRDHNAAANTKREGLRILAAGCAESLNACGGDVRPAAAGNLRRSRNGRKTETALCAVGIPRL